LLSHELDFYLLTEIYHAYNTMLHLTYMRYLSFEKSQWPRKAGHYRNIANNIIHTCILMICSFFIEIMYHIVGDLWNSRFASCGGIASCYIKSSRIKICLNKASTGSSHFLCWFTFDSSKQIVWTLTLFDCYGR